MRQEADARAGEAAQGRAAEPVQVGEGLLAQVKERERIDEAPAQAFERPTRPLQRREIRFGDPLLADVYAQSVAFLDRVDEDVRTAPREEVVAGLKEGARERSRRTRVPAAGGYCVEVDFDVTVLDRDHEAEP